MRDWIRKISPRLRLEGSPLDSGARQLLDQHVEKIANSRALAKVPRVIGLFRHLMNLKKMNADAGRFKEYTIGVEFFHKPVDWNPKPSVAHGRKGDSTVRRAMLDLRVALREFYELEGFFDPVTIFLVEGSYEPVCEYNRVDSKAAPLDQESRALILRIKSELERRSDAGSVAARRYAQELLQRGANRTNPRVRGLSSLVVVETQDLVFPERVGWVAMDRAEVVGRRRQLSWEGIYADACIKAIKEHDWAAAREMLDAAAVESHGESQYLWWYPAILATTGDIESAATLLVNAIEHAAYANVRYRVDASILLVMLGRYEEAKELLNIDADQVSVGEQCQLAIALAGIWEALGDNDRAYQAIEPHMDAMFSSESPTQSMGVLAFVLGRSGHSEARDFYDGLVAQRRDEELQICSAFTCGLAALGLGELDEAVQWLSESVTLDLDPMCAWFHIYPALRHLRDNESFRTLLRELRLWHE